VSYSYEIVRFCNLLTQQASIRKKIQIQELMEISCFTQDKLLLIISSFECDLKVTNWSVCKHFHLFSEFVALWIV